MLEKHDGTMIELAEDFGNLRYDALVEFLLNDERLLTCRSLLIGREMIRRRSSFIAPLFIVYHSEETTSPIKSYSLASVILMLAKSPIRT